VFGLWDFKLTIFYISPVFMISQYIFFNVCKTNGMTLIYENMFHTMTRPAVIMIMMILCNY